MFNFAVPLELGRLGGGFDSGPGAAKGQVYQRGVAFIRRRHVQLEFYPVAGVVEVLAPLLPPAGDRDCAGHIFLFHS